MIVFFVAILESVFYLCAIPVKLSVRLDDFRAGSQLSVFGARLNSGKGKGPNAMRVIRIIRHIRFERLEARGRVCLGDAAATALLCGGMTAALNALPARSKAVRLTPDFRSDRVAVHLCGMLRARSGQIILAMLKIWTEAIVLEISGRLVNAPAPRFVSGRRGDH